MENISLLPYFIIWTVLNFILLIVLTTMQWKFREYRFADFYLLMIVFFLYLAFISRVINIGYLLIQTPHEEYNRISDKYYGDYFYNYFSTFPLAFYCLAAVTYMGKLFNSYYSTLEWVNFDQELSFILCRRIKIAWAFIWVFSIIAIIVDVELDIGYEIIRAYYFVFYLLSSIGIVTSWCIYLSKLK